MEARTSKKRDAIFRVIKGSKEHPSAYSVYNGLKNEIPDLSLGTVYRNIALFKQQGRIVTVSNVGGEERYDAVTEPHLHFVCSECGDVVDIEDSLDLRGYEDAVSSKLGAKIESHSVIFNGRCKNCKDRND